MSDKVGARPTDRALVSDEAATHLRPSGFDPSRNATTVVFTDKDGNRFVFPGWIIFPDDPRSTFDFWGQANLIRARLGGDSETIEFDPNNFPHVETQAGSSIFLHGSETVWLIGGPTFDAIAMEARSDTTGTGVAEGESPAPKGRTPND